jgi:hypothetical protein
MLSRKKSDHRLQMRICRRKLSHDGWKLSVLITSRYYSGRRAEKTNKEQNQLGGKLKIIVTNDSNIILKVFRAWSIKKLLTE